MPGPLDIIEQGLTEGSLAKIAKGYEKLTGKKVAVPKQKAGKAKPAAPSPATVVEKPPRGWEAALSFYANSVNWLSGGDDFTPTPAPVATDRGQRAREALGDQPPPPVTDEEEDQEDVVPLPPSPTPRRSRDVNTDQFKIQHGKAKGGKNYCSKMPFTPEPNQFKDDGRIAANDTTFDKKVTAGLLPSPRKDPVQYVKVKCSKCSNTYEVSRVDAPRKLEEDDENNRYVCNTCISSTVRGARR